ncbi:MAG: divalent-cation tolerance protein CutA [Campylobacterota bacterium]|nr:divalent-cation tolerance protein CutA [Campylobacterota bacterium]
MKPFIVNTTCSSKKEAKKIADILLSKKLAACIQISKIDSFYIWENKRCEDKEYLLTIKTKKENYKQIKRKIKENHSYDLPEIIGIKITKISKDYKKFIKGNTK